MSEFLNNLSTQIHFQMIDTDKLNLLAFFIYSFYLYY